MKVVLFIIIFVAGLSLASAEETTFESILGRATVKTIVDQAVRSLEVSKEQNGPRASVEPRLAEDVVVLAGKTKVTVSADEELSTRKKRLTDRLTKGVAGFFNDYRDFTAQRESNAEVVMLRLSKLESFLEWFKKEKRCGKIPCNIPPCCGDCDGCEEKK